MTFIKRGKLEEDFHNLAAALFSHIRKVGRSISTAGITLLLSANTAALLLLAASSLAYCCLLITAYCLLILTLLKCFFRHSWYEKAELL